MSQANAKTNGLRALQVLAVAMLAMAWALALLPAGGHDQLWFLLMAQRWLHGAMLYGPEVFDSNTPAVVWLSAIPVWVAERMGLGIPLIAKTFVVMLECGVAWVCWRIVRGSVSRVQGCWLLVMFVLFYGVVPARDFGQRDVLAGLLLLPYLLAAARFAPRFRHKADAKMSHSVLWLTAIGVLAGVGVCLKPQQVLVPVVVELWLLLRSRGRSLRRVEPWVIVVVGALFVGTVKVCAPLYFSLTVPTVLATYWAVGHLTMRELVVEAAQLIVLAAIAFGVCALAVKKGTPPVRHRDDARMGHPLSGVTLILLVAGVAAGLAYLAQGTGWYYQQMPAMAFFGGAIAFGVLALVEGKSWRISNALPWGLGALGLLSVCLTLHFSGFPLGRGLFGDDAAYGIAVPDPGFFRGLKPGTSVATLTTSVDEAMMPVFRYKLTWAQRTNNLWLLPAILRAQDPAVAAKHHLAAGRLEELESLQRRWMVEDLERWKPELVLVDRCEAPEVHCQVLEDRHDDLLSFFEKDREFMRVWVNYRLERTVGPYDAYVRVTSY